MIVSYIACVHVPPHGVCVGEGDVDSLRIVFLLHIYIFSFPIQNSTKKPTPDHIKMKPFKFHLDERFKQKPSTPSTNTVPMAEAIEKYQKATPPRFRSNPGSASKKWVGKANVSDHSTSSSSSGNSSHTTTSTVIFNSKLTFPNTPNLLTKGRSRPVTAKSAVDEEEDIVAQMKE